jgi:hypothetical protein
MQGDGGAGGEGAEVGGTGASPVRRDVGASGVAVGRSGFFATWKEGREDRRRARAQSQEGKGGGEGELR